MNESPRSLPQPFSEMLADYRIAKKEYEADHKSAHWDVFSADYEALIRSPQVWPDCRRNGITAGMETSFEPRLMDPPDGTIPFAQPLPRQIDDKSAESLNLLAHTLAAMTGRQLLEELCECEVGRPQVHQVSGLQLNLNEVLLTYHAWQIARFSAEIRDQPVVIVEIGGGYGSLAAKLKKLFPRAMVVIFDLPEVCAIQSWYLSQLFPGARRIGLSRWRELGASTLQSGLADFVILPGWCLDALGDESVDLALNLRSMMEMRQAVVATYFRGIERAVRPGGRFYCVNRYQKRVGEEMSVLKHYPFDDRWRVLLSQPCWAQEHIHELLTERESAPAAYPPRFVMASLPPF